MIKREKYLQELISYKDVNIIKVLIGIRNCGKTTILLQYVSILQNQKDSNIIFIDFNEYETIKAIKNTDDLNDYIHSKYLPLKKNYLLIDEVQEIDKFQLVLNS
jgi:predicted AAA+ superfamily ATPase